MYMYAIKNFEFKLLFHMLIECQYGDLDIVIKRNVSICKHSCMEKFILKVQMCL